MNTVTWMTFALLGPFWWGLGLLALALLGDLWPGRRSGVERLFDWLGRP